MRGHVVLSLKQLAGNSCKVPENVLCPAVIVSPVVVDLLVASKFKLRTQKTILPQWWQMGGLEGLEPPQLSDSHTVYQLPLYKCPTLHII